MLDPEIFNPLKQIITDHDITILEAGTGSGKSTRGPILFHQMFPRFKIAMTEPRVLNVTSLSTYIAGLLGVTLGQEVGYKYRFHSAITSKTYITIMTDALLIEDFLTDITKYDMILVDEVHERNLNIDLILTFIKLFFMKKERIKPIKFVFLNATINKDIIKEYYGSHATVGSFVVPGRIHSINHIYYKSSKAENVIMKIISDGLEGDILVFLPTKKRIGTLVNELKAQIGDAKIIVIALYRGIPKEQEELATSGDAYRALGYERKIIVSTPIAEVGITIEGVKHVIETGQANIARYDQVRRIMYFDTKTITKFNVIQRCGRAGRTAPGTCHHLYTLPQYEAMPEEKIPEIANSDLFNPIMSLVGGTKSVKITKRILEMVPAKINQRAIEEYFISLYKYGLLVEDEMTAIGKLVHQMGIDVILSILLIQAFKQQVQVYMIPIITMMSVSYEPAAFFDEITDEIVDRYRSSLGDPFVLLNIYHDYVEGKLPPEAHRDNFELLKLNEQDIKKKVVRILENKIIVPSMPKFDESASISPRILRCFQNVFQNRALYFPYIRAFLTETYNGEKFDPQNPFFIFDPSEVVQIGFSNPVIINRSTYTFRMMFKIVEGEEIPGA